MTPTIVVTPDGLLATRIMLVVLTVVLEFKLFTVTLILVCVSMGVLPTLLLIKVSTFPLSPRPSRSLIWLIPLVGSSLAQIRLRRSRLVIPPLMVLVLLASTIAPWTLVDPSSPTVVGVLVPTLLLTMTYFVHPLL